MSQWISLDTPTGRLRAWRADPPTPPRGALVVVQEIFGVNEHIRAVCQTFADHGYVAMAPAFFDHFEHDVQLRYDPEGVARGLELVGQLGFERALQDVHATAAQLGEYGKVGVVGYCWGGTVAWLAACRLDVACAAAYYGRQIADFPDDHPRCPTIAHFGAEDPLIPLDAVERVRAANPGVPLHVYSGAGHGFNCDARRDFRPDAAAMALGRTLTLFAETLRPA